MIPLTLPAAASQLATSVDELWRSVSELVLTVEEDRPEGLDLAAVDEFSERVIEMQGSVASARDLLRPGAPLVPVLPEVAASLDDAHRRYWRDMRGYAAVAALRGASRRHGGGLPAWRGAVEASAERCEAPFARTAEAVNACWQEICHASMPRRSS
ncbi:hypothetical protein [Actinoplanes sp. NPDC051851]|uniref:hypothetical protein n=1 Tax=Actinoplanes sp. NPDC051851 TaxID=3154753 RepID=UPI00343C80EC